MDIIKSFFRNIIDFFRNKAFFNNKVYVFIIAISLYTLYRCHSFDRMINQDIWPAYIETVSLGCLSSAIVAWYIDRSNYYNLKKKTRIIRRHIFHELTFLLTIYIEEWANIYCRSFDDKKCRNQKHTWKEWVELCQTTNDGYSKGKQGYILLVLSEQFNDNLRELSNEIDFLVSQIAILEIDEIISYEELKNLKRLRKALCIFLPRMEETGKNIYNFFYEYDILRGNIKGFLANGCRDGKYFNTLSLDQQDQLTELIETYWFEIGVINEDILSFINTWNDVRYLKSCTFQPYNGISFHDN